MGDGNLTRKDIEARLNNVGDYVKIDFLSQCLRKPIDFDTKKFVQLKLALLYEARNMYAEAARLMNSTADINTTFQGKVNDFMKACELFIKAGKYGEADDALKKALVSGTEKQKFEIKAKRKEIIIKQAEYYVKRDKRKHAMEAYEQALKLELNPDEKKKVQAQLLILYQQLGRVKESMALERQVLNPASSQATQMQNKPAEQTRRPSRLSFY